MQITINTPSLNTLVIVGSAAAAVFILSIALKSYNKYKKSQKKYPKNIVILHQFPTKENLPTLYIDRKFSKFKYT